MSPELPHPDETSRPPAETQERLRPDSYSARPAQHKDIEALRPILQQWVKDRNTHELLSDEVEDILSQIEQSIEGNGDRQYIVAQSGNGEVVGVMGLANPGEEMHGYAQTENPQEIVNAFVEAGQRSRGVGKVLFTALEQLALQCGGTELVVNSGPRYEDTAWEFYNRRLGEPVAIMKDKYGPGGDAPVWRKELS